MVHVFIPIKSLIFEFFNLRVWVPRFALLWPPKMTNWRDRFVDWESFQQINKRTCPPSPPWNSIYKYFTLWMIVTKEIVQYFDFLLWAINLPNNVELWSVPPKNLYKCCYRFFNARLVRFVSCESGKKAEWSKKFDALWNL